MNFHRPLVIHKSVWERLKKETETPTEKPVKHNENYIKELIEKSQEWIKAWPDSVEGHIKKLREQEKKQHEKDLALIRDRKKGKIKTFRAEAIQRARKMIFEDSCYGKQLISALIVSKTLEERDAQVQIQKKIKQESTEKSALDTSLYCTFNLDANHEKNWEQNKLRDVECTKHNRWMQKQREKQTEYMLKQQKDELEPLIIDENKLEDVIKKEYQKSIEEYNINQEICKEQRKKQKELDDKLIKLYQKEQDKRKYKIQQIFNKIHKDKQDEPQHRHVYKIIESSLETQNQRYHFIKDRIKTMEQQTLVKDEEDVTKAKCKRKDSQAIAEFNRNVDTIKKIVGHSQKYICDNQCLIPTSNKVTQKKSRSSAISDYQESCKLKFLKPQNKLAEELKKRAEEPSAWTGTTCAHAQFAQVADQTLQECKYKNMARKVVDNYRRLHNLDSTSLPVPNY